MKFEQIDGRLSAVEGQTQAACDLLAGNGQPGFKEVRQNMEVFRAVLFPEVGRNLIQAIAADVAELKSDLDAMMSRNEKSLATRWVFWGMAVAAAANVISAILN